MICFQYLVFHFSLKSLQDDINSHTLESVKNLELLLSFTMNVRNGSVREQSNRKNSLEYMWTNVRVKVKPKLREKDEALPIDKKAFSENFALHMHYLICEQMSDKNVMFQLNHPCNHYTNCFYTQILRFCASLCTLF